MDADAGAGAEASVDADAGTGAKASVGAQAEDTQEQSGSNTLIIVVVAAAVVILIVVLVLLLRRKKPAPAPVQPSAAGGRTMPAPAGNPVVRSLAPQHNGACFPLNGKQILIGRNVGSCTVIFREGTPGVSSRHCSLEYDKASGDFILTDLKSTYGTFLANGQQLSPGIQYRLKPGDQFYLGGSENMLRVEL